MLRSVQEVFLSHKRETVLGVIIFIMASLSFGLGYLAERTFNHIPILIEQCSTR